MLKNVTLNQITLDYVGKGIRKLHPFCKIQGKIKEVSPFLLCSVYGTISIQCNLISIKSQLIYSLFVHESHVADQPLGLTPD